MDRRVVMTDSLTALLARASYPRVYRASAGLRTCVYGFAALIAVIAVALLYGSFKAHDLEGIVTDHAAMFAVKLFLGAGLTAAWCARSTIVLRADSIQVNRLFRSRTLRRDAIVGRRWYGLNVQRRHPMLFWVAQFRRGTKQCQVLVPWDGKPLMLDQGYPQDAVLEAWVKSLPDLDQHDLEVSLAEQAASQAQLAADPAYGESPQERVDRLDFFRKVAKVANRTAIGSLIPGFLLHFFPAQLVPLVALLPWCAVGLAAWSKGLLRFDTLRNDVRPNILSLLLVPCVMLGMGSPAPDFDTEKFLYLALLAGLPLVAAVVLVLRAQRRSAGSRGWVLPILVPLVVAATYGLCIVGYANNLLDHAAPQVFSAEVVGKSYDPGSKGRRGRSESYTLSLGAWGPHPAGDLFDVDRQIYNDTSLHSTVCPMLHPGGLGMRWYRFEVCAKDGSLVRHDAW